jgi:hypothetical protein
MRLRWSHCQLGYRAVARKEEHQRTGMRNSYKLQVRQWMHVEAGGRAATHNWRSLTLLSRNFSAGCDLALNSSFWSSGSFSSTLASQGYRHRDGACCQTMLAGTCATCPRLSQCLHRPSDRKHICLPILTATAGTRHSLLCSHAHLEIAHEVLLAV